MTYQMKKVKKQMYRDSLKTKSGRNKAREDTKDVMVGFDDELTNIFKNLSKKDHEARVTKIIKEYKDV